MAKVALYYPWLYLRSGLERTVLELTARSRHEWTLFTNHFDREGTYPEFKERRVVELRRAPVDRRYMRVAAAAVTILRQRLDLTDFDALLVCCEGLGDLILWQNRSRPAFCLCFTPLRAAFDPEYQARHLATAPAWRRLIYPLLRRVFTVADRWAWQRYQHVFCISHEVRTRVLRGRLASPDRLEVVHPGVDLERWRPTEASEPFFLLPGRIKWTKNVELAIQAFQAIQGEMPDGFSLVIAGAVDEGNRRYFQHLIRLVGNTPTIQIVLNPSDDELLALYQRCYGVVYPSFNEDWGLVPLEAMACGKPVVAVGRGGPTETVVQGSTGLLTAPTVESFAEAMRRLVREPEMAQAMGVEAHRRAQEFGWDHFVMRIDEKLSACSAG